MYKSAVSDKMQGEVTSALVMSLLQNTRVIQSGALSEMKLNMALLGKYKQSCIIFKQSNQNGQMGVVVVGGIRNA